MIRHQFGLATLDPRHLGLQLLDLINLPLPTVLSGHLVLPPPTDVAAERQLLLRQLVLGQQVIELVHGEVDDVGAGDREAQILRLMRSGIKNDPNLEDYYFLPFSRPWSVFAHQADCPVSSSSPSWWSYERKG